MACSWTSWDARVLAVEVAVKQGGKRVCSGFSAMTLWSGRGQGDIGFGSEGGRGLQGTRERVRGGVYCRPQCSTAATRSGAGEVFDVLAARNFYSNFQLIFGGSSG